MRDWNYRHHQKCRGRKCRSKQLWKAKHLLITAHTTWSI